MKEIKVLLTPSSSGMAIAAIKALKLDKDIKILSTDFDELAPGLYLSDRGYLVPPFSDSSYYDKLIEIIEKEKVNVVIPCLDPILSEFSERRNQFEKAGAKVLVSELSTIKITRDKWETFNRLKNVISLPASFISKNDVNISYPIFIKPRFGSGSVDIYKIESKEQLDFWFSRVSNPIIQEYLPGKEYTVDCLANLKGELLVAIPRERIETKAGISVKSKIIENKILLNMAQQVSKELKFFGPFFLQVKEDINGIPKLTEINARIGGTMCLSSFSGSNIHCMAVKMALGYKVGAPTVQKGLYVSRYWAEIYLTENEIKKKVLKI